MNSFLLYQIQRLFIEHYTKLILIKTPIIAGDKYIKPFQLNQMN